MTKIKIPRRINNKMAGKTTILLVVMVIVLTASSAFCTMSEKSKQRIKGGLAGGEKIFLSLSKLGDAKERRVFDALGKMSGFLGAAGGLVSFALVFLPKSESIELRFMKLKFAEVNQKLDRITTELDNIKDLIKFENQRSVYVDSASKILFSYQKLSEFLQELETTPCTDEKNCQKVRARIASRYVNDFDVRQHIYKILNGSARSTSEFGDPLLDVIKNTFKCDVGKIDHFANGVLKLAFRAQQVVLSHEKLVGSNYSITQSMNSWLNSLYEVRARTYALQKLCYDDIKNYMIADINDKKYQVGVASNAQATQQVKGFMDDKYNWLGWVTHAYGAYGGSKHCVTNNYGAFWNMPKDQNERRRNLIVTFTDKSGTYSNQKVLVLNALDSIVANTNFYSVRNDACDYLPKVVEELGKKGVWKYITSLNVLRDYDDFIINADNDLTYISEVYEFESYRKIKSSGKKEKQTHDTVRLVIVLKSMEETNGVTCDKVCLNQGSCVTPPHSSTKYCQCKPFYQGETCEEHARSELAKTMDALLETTLSLPMLSDVFYDIKDLREYVGISFGAVRSAISELEAEFKKAFDELSRKLTNQYQWTNLNTHYSSAIRNIEFYAYRFKELHKRYPSTKEIEGKKLATAILAADGIEKWLYELNFLFLGRSGTPLVSHKSLMVVFMERYVSQACIPAYKAAVDHTWNQLVLLQQTGFTIFAQALDMMGRPVEQTAKLYKIRTDLQASTLNQLTCEYRIVNSANVQCTGGRYIYPAMSIINHCKANYYATGAVTTTCVSKASGCSPCNCNAAGSNGLGCSDLTGQCACKPGFYGKRCENRDCVWSPWSGYSGCTKGCDYGGTKTRTRSHQATQQGNGKPCSGPGTETTACFHGCCAGQFHCSVVQKCIPWSQKCNYDNDCGDNQDEQGCPEACHWKYTPWNDAGGGNVVYLDRHRPNCGGNGHVLKEFHLGRSGGNIRYEYQCCTLNKPICTLRLKYNHWSYDGDGDAVYLDRQVINCGTSFLNFWGIERNGDHLRYIYRCCDVVQQRHKDRLTCYQAYTGYTYDGDGETFYFDRQRVRCQDGWFLSKYHLQRNADHDHWRYYYVCCKVKV